MHAKFMHRSLIAVLVVVGLGLPMLLGLGLGGEILFPFSSLGILMTFHPVASSAADKGTRRQEWLAHAYSVAESAVGIALNAWVAVDHTMYKMNMIAATTCAVCVFLLCCFVWNLRF